MGSDSAASSALSFLKGATSGLVSTLALQPLDVLKTRAQVNHNLSYLSIFRNITQENGFKGFWRGTTPSLLRTVPGVGLYFTFVDLIQPPAVRHIGSPPLRDFVIGSSARIAAGTLLMPFTVVKARMESGLFNYKSVPSGILSILQKEGVVGLYRGTIVTAFRDAPYSGMYVTAYRYLQDTGMSKFSAGLTAGLLASIVTQPLDVLKTQVQTRVPLVSLSFTSFFRGGLPRILRRSCVSTISWVIYDALTSTSKV